ncbi:MAG: histidine kinase, partial [Bacteroidota bacterium]
SVFFVSTIIHLYRQRMALQKHQAAMEKMQLTTELKYLKSQLNPHFLFNALNSIFFLIKKDPDQAADALAGFSDILRYQLYQTNSDQIPLADELESLQKYIQLAALRKSSDLDIKTKLPLSPNGAMITPLLLLPLVENAFKHTGHDRGFIYIEGDLMDHQFHFLVRNTASEEQNAMKQVEEEGGIGLTNIRRRLNLLYPNRHQLKIHKSSSEFSVDLSLDLNQK